MIRDVLKPFANTRNYVWWFQDIFLRSRQTAVPSCTLLLVSFIRNEDRYLVHWLKHHFSLGVDHALLYLNEADPACVQRIFALLQDNGLQEKVSLIHWPDSFSFLLRKGSKYNKSRLLPVSQELAFQHFKKYYGSQCEYYTKLDPDEYLFVEDESKTLKDFLGFEGNAAVMGYNFGSKDALDTELPVTERFFFRESTPRHKKSIAHSATSYEHFNAHIAFSKYNTKIQGLRLHHYGVKTWGEYQNKIHKSGYMVGDYSEKDFDALNAQRTTRDTFVLNPRPLGKH